MTQLEQATNVEPCRICSAVDWHVLYQGPVRRGRFGQVSDNPSVVFRCGQCGVGHLHAENIDYELTDYRRLVDGESSIESYYQLHDVEQADKVRVLGTANLRGKVVADIGCGAGAFLDLVKGFTAQTLGVEPAKGFHEELTRKGHVVYPYAHEVDESWYGQIDIAVCFSVIEHVLDPAALLRDIRRLLRPGGVLLISTPNSRDWMLEALPQEYARFFYRVVHKWYFDERSLRSAARLTGYSSASVSFVQRFDLSNSLLWLRDKRPTGLGAMKLWPVLDAAYRSTLEAEGRADYLYAMLYP